MSLILDALNKADREREYRDAIPDLKTVHGAPRPTRDYRQWWLIGGLVAALLMVVALLVIVWLRMPGHTSAPVERDPEAANAPAQIATAPAPVIPKTTLPELNEPAQISASLASTSPEVQALYLPQQDTKVMQVIEPQIQTVPEAPVVITPANPRRSSVDEDLARQLWEESRREAQQPVPASVLPPTPTAAAKKTEPKSQPLPADLPAEETLAGHANIPFLHELPISVQDTIPTLMYAKHEYDKGFVVINKEELQMGSAARGGVLIERILADGVLLSLNGTEFKLSSLSSWVNY